MACQSQWVQFQSKNWRKNRKWYLGDFWHTFTSWFSSYQQLVVCIHPQRFNSKSNPRCWRKCKVVLCINTYLTTCYINICYINTKVIYDEFECQWEDRTCPIFGLLSWWSAKEETVFVKSALSGIGLKIDFDPIWLSDVMKNLLDTNFFVCLVDCSSVILGWAKRKSNHNYFFQILHKYLLSPSITSKLIVSINKMKNRLCHNTFNL